ncbi:MAG: peptidase [Paenibacillus sp.]|nr:peptidase [Paenibacillus sp.]
MTLKNRYIIQAGLLLLFLLFLRLTLPVPQGASLLSDMATQQASANHSDSDGAEKTSSWMLKWKGEPEADFAAMSQVIKQDYQSGILVARPASGISEAEWVYRWSHSYAVQYITENQVLRVSAAVTPNDPFVSRQKYLEQIHAPEAWTQVNYNDSLIIALVDTGVDLEHPDLKDNLVPGINLVQRNQPPQDDNGHGTMVAGVIAASGNNNKGVSGLLWKAKIMPIKALEKNGVGDEDKLGEGIRYAVDHGAKIIVLSVGLLRNDPFLKETVQYAEDKGVLLVAATGNDDGSLVKYPAAYPSVLAVGGVRTNNQVEPRSNYGPELDLVAPWSVYTTAMNGQYKYEEGSSMAVPQVAAAAALAWSVNPTLSVYELRNLLRQTAEDLGQPGWDMYTGYGLLRVDKAVSQPYVNDMYEPNDSVTEAKPFPLNSMIVGELRDGQDRDWFTIDAPYDGTVKLEMNASLAVPANTQWIHYSTAHPEGVVYPIYTLGTIDVNVSKGSHLFLLMQDNSVSSTAWPYRITNSFHIGSDPFEDNDRSYKAYKLAPRDQVVTGNFDKENDQDWFSMTLERSGIIKLRLTSDTKRMDLIMRVQPKGGTLITVDQNADGESESYRLEAYAGTYYFQVDKTDNQPVNGTYTLEVQYEERPLDMNEPNDKSYQATLLGNDYELEGVIDRNDQLEDIDWFKLYITDTSLLQLHLSQIPANRKMNMQLLNNSLAYVTSVENGIGETQLSLQQPLSPGTYYIKLSANANFRDQLYKISAKIDYLVSGYIDIAGHWAQPAMEELSNKQIISGFGDYTFRPERSVTRAEAVSMLVRAFGYAKYKAIDFTDLSPGFWAYDAISLAAQAGIIQGYPDRTMRPDQPLTRIEMAVLFANALKISGKQRGNHPFDDVELDHWAVPILKQMKAEGWITGYDDGGFHPDQLSTRAEFASMLTRVMGK